MERNMDGTGTSAGPGGRRELSGPMRLTLMSSDGTLQSLWLPPFKEGRYRFEERSSIATELYVEARNGEWYIFAGEGCAIRREGVFLGQFAPLEDRCLLVIEYGGQKYVLYSEVESERSNIFSSYYIEQQGEILIGRAATCDICYDCKLASRVHAALCWTQEGWFIQDKGSRNGVYLNNRRVTYAKVNVGDVIYIIGLRIAMGVGFVAINNGDGQVTITTPKLHPLTTEASACFRKTPVYGSEAGLFKRKPRRRTLLDLTPIELEPPPMNAAGNRMPFLLKMGSPALMGGKAIASGNIMMALTSLVLPMLTNGFTEKERKEFEAHRTEYYKEYLRAKSFEIETARQNEELILRSSYPAVADTLNFVPRRDRVWERRKTDDDFAQVRIGVGQVPLMAERSFPKKKFDVKPDPLETEMYELAERKIMLRDVPILLPLQEDFVCGINGGSDQQIALLRDLLMQLSICHSHEELKLVLLADPADAEKFSFLRYLPHAWDAERSIRLIATTKAEACQIGEFLKKHLGETPQAGNTARERLRREPYFVVVALNRVLLDTMEFLRDFMRAEKNSGVSVLAAYEGLPIECHKLVELNEDGSGALIDLRHPERSDQLFQLDPCDPALADRCMKELAGLQVRSRSAAYLLPKMVTFLEMFEAGKVEHLNPLKRWGENNPVKSLAAPVGVGTDGELFYLDLHEKSQGPHGLVAGMTGSGKSEFIITYILSMAVNYSPDEVAFILIDYKGGGLAGAFDDPRRGIHLPHLVGTITNLDGAAIQRSLLSIQSELKRRQAVFNQAKSLLEEGTMDIYDYQKYYRSGKVKEPMPHLFIISDEFAELKSQRPEFMDGLISIARIGRSLGVHLILATQKPSGVVNDQIMSNTKFRVCLRVQGKSDSMDMIKRPDAAELKDTGRFYLQVGYNEYFALGQSAWCGADYQPQDQVVVEVDNAVQFIDATGQTVLKVKPRVERKKSGVKQIVAVVRYLSDLAKREHIEPRKLWLDPLPDTIDYEELPAVPPAATGIPVAVGMTDDPEKLRQFPLVLDLQKCKHLLVVGHSGSGKTSFLQSLLYGITTQYPPERVQHYLLDFSGGGLGFFRGAPHCGGVFNESNEGSIGRLFKRLNGLVAERKKLFDQADVSSYEAYIQLAPLPLILVVIDNLTGLSALKTGSNLLSSLNDYMRNALNYGIRFIIGCSHLNEVNARIRQEIGDHVALTLKDKYAYSDALGCRCNYVPADKPGRGLCVLDGTVLEYQAALLGAHYAAAERSAFLRRELARKANTGAGTVAYRFPVLDPEETYENFCADIPRGRIPLGYSLSEIRKVSMPFAQLFTMNLYFGNPAGVKPVLQNLLYAMERERARCVIVRREANSVFQGIPETERLRCLSSTREDSVALWQLMAGEIQQRKLHRNAWCDSHGLAYDAPDVMKQAGPYLRTKADALFVVFESLADFCKNADESCTPMFQAMLAGGRGYHFYFIGCTYPEDPDKLATEPLFKLFLRDDFLLFFGGQYDKQKLTMLPLEQKRETGIIKDYGMGLMKYRGNLHPFRMPCGPLEQETADPDELPII